MRSLGAGGAAWALVLAWSTACVAPPPGKPDATPPEVDPSTLPPTVVTAQLADAVAGVPYGERLLARDGVPPYTWTLSGPAWLSVNAGTGELRGVPPGDAGAPVSLTATASDTAGRSGSRDFNLQVLGCAPGASRACLQASGNACLLGVNACLPGGAWSGCDAGAASTSASGCGAGCAACGPDSDRCASGGTQCACGTGTNPCAPGSSCCPDPGGGARCANLSTDVQACGSCGTRCAAPLNAGATCDGGVCGAACQAGFAACDGRTLDGCEVNLRTDPNHCGSCPTACSGTSGGSATCDGGACDLSCNASAPQYCGLRDCRPYDVSNCGGCNVSCANPGVNAGAPLGCAGPNACSYACQTGWGDCNAGTDGCETELTANPRHCGSCPNDCVAAGWDGGCVNSQCARCYQCPANPNGSHTVCCGEKCTFVPGDNMYECFPCPGPLVNGGC
ncbi:MAG TPA: Ig domain-containing protein [Myxococcales bacterium]|nr:Ig domain-containing protein [Myxococcales bacterium]